MNSNDLKELDGRHLYAIYGSLDELVRGRNTLRAWDDLTSEDRKVFDGTATAAACVVANEIAALPDTDRPPLEQRVAALEVRYASAMADKDADLAFANNTIEQKNQRIAELERQAEHQTRLYNDILGANKNLSAANDSLCGRIRQAQDSLDGGDPLFQ